MFKTNCFIISCLYLTAILCQEQDLEFCDINKIEADPAQLPIPTFPLDSQFQASIERNSYGETEDIQEYFDGKNNLGVAITVLGGLKTSVYANFGINELLLINGKKCL